MAPEKQPPTAEPRHRAPDQQQRLGLDASRGQAQAQPEWRARPVTGAGLWAVCLLLA